MGIRKVNVWRISKVILFGLILSPIVASLALNTLFIIQGLTLHGTSVFRAHHYNSFFEKKVHDIFASSIMIGLFSLVPNIFVLYRGEKEKIQDCSYYCTFGAAIGIIVPFIVFLALGMSLRTVLLPAMYMLFGAIAGSSAGLFYWAFVGRDWTHPQHQQKSRMAAIHDR